MNRMISLFQSKGDQAFRAYVANRNDFIAKYLIGSPEWQAAVLRGVDLKAKSDTWFKAADLLRKEEINQPSVALLTEQAKPKRKDFDDRDGIA